MGDSGNPTNVQVNADGSITYEFAGTIIAQGVDLDATSSDTAPGITALIRWLDANNVDVADLFGNLNAGVSELLLRALITADSPTAIAELIAVDPMQANGPQAVLAASYNPSAALGSRISIRASQFAGPIVLGSGQLAERVILDDAGRSDFSSLVYRAPLNADVNTDNTERVLWGLLRPGIPHPPMQPIPGNALGTDRTAKLKMRCSFANSSGAASIATFRVYWNGALLVPSFAFSYPNAGVGTRRFFDINVDVGNQNATNVQFARVTALFPGALIGGAPAGITNFFEGAAYGAADTTLSQNLQVTVQHASASALVDTTVELATLAIE